MNVKRGNHSEILMSSLSGRTAKMVRKLVSGAANAQKVDEHGNWEFGCEFDRKGRGEALNWDLYGIGYDFHSRRLLVVIQVRQFARRHKNYFPEIKKSYFLIGRNEDDSVFAHPVSANVIHSAIKREADVIRAVQSWIFGADYTKVIRQGDIALVPMKRKPGGDYAGVSETIQESHHLMADELRANGDNSLYALNPHMTHMPGVHPDVCDEGWFKVFVGRRSNFYRFAAPTVD